MSGCLHFTQITPLAQYLIDNIVHMCCRIRSDHDRNMLSIHLSSLRYVLLTLEGDYAGLRVTAWSCSHSRPLKKKQSHAISEDMPLKLTWDSNDGSDIVVGASNLSNGGGWIGELNELAVIKKCASTMSPASASSANYPVLLLLNIQI